MPCAHSGGGFETISSRPWAPCAGVKVKVKKSNQINKTSGLHKSSSRASDSRSSREGWEVRWKSCSSMVSWVPVKRLRERFVAAAAVVVVAGLDDALKRRSRSSEE